MWLEIFGVITGILYVILEVRQNRWLWPLGVVTSGVYILVFFTGKFYADAGLQFYYVLISVYGWYLWSRGRRQGIQETSPEALPVTRLHRRYWLPLALVFVGSWAGISYLLVRHTDSPVPLGDAFTTALAIVATWMLARKYIEHWFLWMVANSVSIGLYLYKGLYPTVVLYLVYTGMAVYGYLEWKKTLHHEHERGSE